MAEAHEYFIIDQYKIPIDCLKGFQYSKCIDGDDHAKECTYSTIHEIYKDKEPYIIKIIPFIDESMTLDFTREVEITKLLSDHKLAPQFVDGFTCRIHEDDNIIVAGFIIMKKYQMNLEQFVKLYPQLFLCYFDNIEEILLNMVREIHSIGVSHNDLHDRNIVVNFDSKKGILNLAFIDFGISTPYKKDNNDERDLLLSLKRIKPKMKIDCSKCISNDPKQI